jgi:hypothetical protein
MHRIIADQFERIRDGDRYWYQLTFSPENLEWLERITFADVIRRNTGLANVQDNPFVYEVAINGRVFNDKNRNHRWDKWEPPLAGWTVQIRDEVGNVRATTTTDAAGFYQFDNHVPPGDDSPYEGQDVPDAPELQDGLSVGYYRLSLVEPSDWQQSTADPDMIDISRGMIVAGMDFGAYRIRQIKRLLAPEAVPAASAESVQPQAGPASPPPGRAHILAGEQAPARSAQPGPTSVPLIVRATHPSIDGPELFLSFEVRSFPPAPHPRIDRLTPALELFLL